jgi:hypothetical protein
MTSASKRHPASTSLLNGGVAVVEQPRISMPIKKPPLTVRKTREYSKGCERGFGKELGRPLLMVESCAGLRLTLHGLKVFRRD